ncbi:hypothetical protein Hanom_Chr15g01354401 [Helianthus anomalus]
MIRSTTQIVIPVADPQPASIKLGTIFTATYLVLFQCIGHVFTVASTALHGGLVAPLRHLWGHYYRRVVFGGQGVVMPRSALSFIIIALLALAEIKSQFQTHPQAIMFSVNSLLMYGLACAVELVVSAAGLDPTSVYAIIAHLGKVGSLCILVASLASLFYL